MKQNCLKKLFLLSSTKGTPKMSDSEDGYEVQSYKGKIVDGLASKRATLLSEYKPFASQEKIAETATSIYFDVMGTTTLKRGKRRAMMAKCAYEAYIINNIFKDPLLLAMKFEVDKKKFMEAQDIFYQMLFNAKNLKKYPKVHLTAKQLLPDIAKHFGFDGIPLDDMNKLIDVMYASSAFLSRSSPRDIAVVVLMSYMEVVKYVNNADKIVSKEDVKNDTKIANTKIKEITSLINTIMNKK